MQTVQIPPPPASVCLSPIGEESIVQGIDKEYELDFVRSKTRKSQVFSGHPFIVEAAIGYGGKLDGDGPGQLLRFANRVPLLYQQGACVITEAVSGINWKLYNLSQQGLPMGPVLILVHVASTNVPFTSESKDAIAAIPEIQKEITLALQELGRELKNFISRRDKNRQVEERARAVCAILPDIAAKVSEIVEKPVPDVTPLEAQIMRKVVVKKRVNNETGKTEIVINNFTRNAVTLTLYCMSPDNAADSLVKPDFTDTIGDEFNIVWKITVEPEASWKTEFSGTAHSTVSVRGVEEKLLVVVDLASRRNRCRDQDVCQRG